MIKQHVREWWSDLRHMYHALPSIIKSLMWWGIVALVIIVISQLD